MKLLLPLLVAPFAWTQSIQVYSEFQRVGSDGQILPLDRAAPPREILSPAVARNAFASYQLVIEAPPGTRFTLHIAQNPENSVAPSLYLQHLVHGVPDRLEQVSLPYTSAMPAGQPALALWMDLWVDGKAPVRRIKVEPQLNVGDRWIIYPIEARVIATRIPAHEKRGGALPPATGRADAAVHVPLKALLCSRPEPGAVAAAAQPPTMLQFIRRNAQQDMALARSLEKKIGVAAVRGVIGGGADFRERWCESPNPPPALAPEWYLRVRDFLYREGEKTAVLD